MYYSTHNYAPNPQAAVLCLAVPTPETSLAIAPEVLIKLLIFRFPLAPSPNAAIALSPPYLVPPEPYLAVPAPELSPDITPVLEIKFLVFVTYGLAGIPPKYNPAAPSEP